MPKFGVPKVNLGRAIPGILVVLWVATLIVGVLFHVFDPSRSSSTLGVAWIIWSVFIVLTYWVGRLMRNDAFDGYLVFVPEKTVSNYKTLERTFYVKPVIALTGEEKDEYLSKPCPYENPAWHFFVDYAWGPICVCLEFILIVNLSIVATDDDNDIILGCVIFNILFPTVMFLIFIFAYDRYRDAKVSLKDFEERKSAATNRYKMRVRALLRRELGLDDGDSPV